MSSTSASSLKVIRPLSSDAVSDAFVCIVPGLEGTQVVRTLKPELAKDSVRVEAFLERERAFIALKHPGVLPIRAAGRMQDGRVYVLSDFIEGPTLAQMGKVPADRAVDIGLQAAAALGAAHAMGLCHGSLSAQAIVVNPAGVVVDFSFSSWKRATVQDPEADIRALAAALLSSLDGGPSASPLFDSTVRKVIATKPTAAELTAALKAMKPTVAVESSVPFGATSLSASGSEVTRADFVAARDEDLVGSQLGSYRVERLIGEGAMGRVYYGRHTRIGREAAIKVLKEEHSSNAELVQRFLQEAKAVNAIKHENIVEIDDFGEQQRPGGGLRVFCVMELLEGNSLTDEMHKGVMSVQRAVKICRQLASALHAAHQVGVVHRDVKPDNVYLNRRSGDADFVKVLDFGVAKLLKAIGDMPSSGTQAGVVIGTPEYMAPEQAIGMPSDARVDIYAVGLVLYELLGGRKPFIGDTFGKLLVQITTVPPPPLPEKTASGESIAPGLSTIVMKCLEKKAEHRFQSALELVEALESFAYSGRTVALTPRDMPVIADTFQRLAPMKNEPKVEPESTGGDDVSAIRPSPVPKIIAAVVGLALVGGGLALFAGSDEAKAPPPPVVAAPVVPPVVDPAPAPVEPAKPPAKFVKLDVSSKPAGATVTRMDSKEKLGTTPLSAQLPRLEGDVLLKFELEGRRAVEKTVSFAGETASVTVELPAETPVKPEGSKEPKKPKGGPKERGPQSSEGTIDPFAN